MGILRIFPAFIHILNNCCCYWCSASRLDKKKKRKKGMSAWGPLLKQNSTLDDGGTFQKQDPRWMENLWLMSLESTDLQDKPLSSFLSLPGHWSPGPLNPAHSGTPRLRLVLRLLSAPLASGHGLVSLRGPSRSPGSHVHSARPRPRGRGGQAASSGTPALGTGALTSQKGREPACRAEVALSARRPLRRVGPSGPRRGAACSPGALPRPR